LLLRRDVVLEDLYVIETNVLEYSSKPYLTITSLAISNFCIATGRVDHPRRQTFL
jgi:hypothetical protein